MKRRFYIIWLWLVSNLQITESKGGSGEKVQMTITGRGQLTLDSPYSLTCKYPQGTDVETLLWKKDSKLVYVDRRGAIWKQYGVGATQGDSSHTLDLLYLHLSDSGVYTCMVHTDRGEEFSAQATVTVTPEIHTVKIGDQDSIHCMDFNEQVTTDSLVWKKEQSKAIVVNGKIVADQQRLYKLQSTGDLLIRNMTKDLAGQYTCFVMGERLNSVAVNIPVEIKPKVSLLAGNNGIIFGVFLGVIIISILAVTLIVEKRI